LIRRRRGLGHFPKYLYPYQALHDVTTTITKNDLQALVTSDNVDEITELGMISIL